MNKEFKNEECSKDIHSYRNFFPFAAKSVEDNITKVSHNDTIGYAIA